MSQHAGPATAGAVAVGLLSAMQARVNGELSRTLDNGLQAAVVSFGSGLVVLVVVALVSPSVRAGLGRVLAAVRARHLARWQVLGGAIGGYYVAAQSLSVPVLGVAVFTVAAVAGQSANSLLVDRIGLGPAGRQDVTPRRAAAGVIAVVAVIVAVSDRLSAGTLDPVVILALLAGIGIAVQQAINGRVANVASNPMSATVLNFTFGTIVLGAALGTLVATGARVLGEWWSAPWWAYLGGLIGIAFIGIAAWAVPIVGVLRFALLSIAGQLTGALLLDVLLPAPGTTLAWNLVLGVLLAFGAVLVSSVRPGARGH